jgi:O-antigen/teichoic acid export membrane protein
MTQTNSSATGLLPFRARLQKSMSQVLGAPGSVKARALAGSLWTLGGYGTKQSIRLGNHLVLAWLLAPQIFGLMALVKVVQHGLSMFSDLGIKPAIIQSTRGDDPDFLNTAWTMQIIRGFVLWICACILAWPFAAFYAQTDPLAWQLLYLLPIVGATAVIEGFNSTALATLNRKIELGKITMLALSSQIVSVCVMIAWALIHPTIWAVVAGAFAYTIYKLFMSHRLVPGHRCRITWNADCARELFSFGKWIFLSTIFTFFALNLDKLVLGKLVSLHDLGIYAIALVFAKAALSVSNRLGSAVLFPVYAHYKGDTRHMMSIAVRARESILWVGGAVSVAFAIGAPVFFETLWDPRYHEAGAVAQWLSIYIWTTILGDTMTRIPLALGNSRALFFANVPRCAGIVFAVGGYVYAGLPGFVAGLAMGPLLAQLFLLRHVPHGRASLVRQGLRHSVLFGTYGVTAITATRWLAESGDVWLWMTSVAGFAAMPVLLASYMVALHVRRDSTRGAAH